MSGFEVRFNGKVISASIGNEGVLPVIVNYLNNCVDPQRNGTHISVSALDNFEHINWLSEKINDVELISIKVVDVKDNSPLINRHPEDSNKMLKDYYELKELLEAEGLL
jgi:hypothetical protein